MAYYWGKFRTIDTSVDPLGQEYKVVIYTQYDGTESPYTFDPITEQPNLGTELTMAARPFIVQYTAESDNIYKPYKCSSATVRFMFGNYNPELFTNNNTNIMVALLKRNNYIQQQGNNYVDVRTNQVVIRKRSYGLWYGFLPSEVDTKCYDVEWVGYALAQSYNQGYALVEEPFELECQDAFSTLKYDGLPFNNLVEIRDVKTLINLIVGQLGTYHSVYYPANIVLPDPMGAEPDISAFARIVQQYRNFIQDDDEPISKMELIESVGKFLNVSFVPWKDSIYIVNYEGVAAGYPYYYVYTLNPNNNLWFNYRSDSPQWGDSVLTDMSSDLALTHECYAGSDTNLTMQPVFSNFRVKCDELEANLMPDLTDSKNYSRLQANTAQTSLYSKLYTSPTYYTGVRWQRGLIGELQEVNGVGLASYIYEASYIDGDNIPHDHYTIVYPQLTPNLFLAQYLPTDPLTHWTGCVILKNTVIKGSESKNASDWFASKERTNLYNSCFGNEIVFWGTNRFGWASVARSSYNSWWSENHQTVLSYNSPKFILRRNKAISIKGDWTFFYNNGFMGLPNTDNDGYTVDRSHLYVTARITVNISDGANTYTYTVRKNEQDEYYLTSGLYRCDLALDDNNYDANRPFGQVFKFKDSIGEDSGLIIPIADSVFASGSTELIAQVYVEIMKPLGVAVDGDMPVFCNSAILRNFDINIVDKEQIETWGYGQITTDFHNKLNKNLDTLEVSNQLSSNQYMNKVNYNYAFKVYDGHYYLLDNLGNTATGITGRPEILKLADIYNQYRDKTIGLDTTVWHNLELKPNTRVKWNNRSMIVDSREIDYEMNRETVRLIEKKLRGDVPQIESKMYLENENGQTINLNPFYNEQFNPQTVDSYTMNGSMVQGYAGDGTQVNATVMFWPSWTEGICANVSIPDALENITVGINANGELFIVD